MLLYHGAYTLCKTFTAQVFTAKAFVVHNSITIHCISGLFMP